MKVNSFILILFLFYCRTIDAQNPNPFEKSIVAPEVGEKAVDFIQKNTLDQKVQLADFVGKVILLNFWGSYCKPCRAEHPELIKLYKKYHEQGFEIIAIANDVLKSDWLNAIQKDSLPWVNVTDLKMGNNEVFQKYQIKYMPNNVLINQQGIVVAKNVNLAFINLLVGELLNK